MLKPITNFTIRKNGSGTNSFTIDIEFKYLIGYITSIKVEDIMSVNDHSVLFSL
jgi:hypothetical protein